MAIAVQIQKVSMIPGGQGSLLVTGKLVASGNYVSGGDTVDLTGATADPTLVGGAGPFLDASLALQNFDAWSMGGNIANGYFPIIGTTQKNNKLKITSAFNTELGAGAYPAAITGDTIGFQALLTPLL